MPKVIVAVQTGADTSEVIRVSNHVDGVEDFVVTAHDITGADTADIERMNADGTFSLPVIAGEVWTLSTTDTALYVDRPGVYRVNKGVTVGTPSIELSTHKEP